MKHRINEGYEVNRQRVASDIYRKFKRQFDTFLSSNDAIKTREQLEKIYVNDEDFETQLSDLREVVEPQLKFIIGYTGIGKSTSLRYFFNLSLSTTPIYNAQENELILPTFFDGHNVEESSNPDNSLNELTRRVSAACDFLEKKFPILNNILNDMKNLEELYNFIFELKPEILQDIESINQFSSIEERAKDCLTTAVKKNPYAYHCMRLKYYLTKINDKIHRIIIILDDIESLPQNYQLIVMRQYMSFYECMQNIIYQKDFNYNVILLMSMRPHTYRLLKNDRVYESYSFSEIFKNQEVNLAKMFTKRFDYYTQELNISIGNITSWKESYNILMNFTTMLEEKYSKMIMQLCFMNVREALRCYTIILGNRYWIQREKEIAPIFDLNPDKFGFTNVSVIRALACQENQVYFGGYESLIPQIFKTSSNFDYTIECLLLIKYFILKNADVYYGVNSIKLSAIYEQLETIFKNDTRQIEIFKNCIGYLFTKKVLRKSIKDKDDVKTIDTLDSLTSDSFLYITPVGSELWRMLSQDSVLLELFREDIFRDYTEHSYNDLSSSDLKERGLQHIIYLDLLEYIEYLCEQEDELRMRVEEQDAFFELFGSNPVASQLLAGVRRSLEYCNFINDQRINSKYEIVKRKVTDMDPQ